VLERTFDVKINDYLYRGRQVYGTPDSPSLPNQIADDVLAVIGLSNIAKPKPMLVVGPTTASTSAPVGYSPQQIATAYNWPDINNTANGNGTTIAVFAAQDAGLLSSDYLSFWNYYGLPSHSVTISDPQGLPGDNCVLCEQEATLDIERSGAMAPGADIIVYEAPEDTIPDFTEMFQTIASDRAAQTVDISYAATESSLSIGDLQTEDGYFQQMAAEGMAVFVADGDGGSPNCQLSSCDTTVNVPVYPASDPYVVAAGGTTLTLNSDNTIANETTWSYVPYSDFDGEYLGTGGAISNVTINGTLFWPEPSWQSGNSVPQNGYRNSSDISLDADPGTGYSLYVGAWTSGGGTSFVAPQLAGLFAVQASLASAPLGQANSAIYTDANSSNYSADFHDITSGNNGAFSAGVGWDHPTGWGSVNAVNLLTHIEGSSTLSPPTNLSAEYTQCVNNRDKYFISWQAGPVGNTTAYDAEYEYGAGGWTVFKYGATPSANLTLLPNESIGIRVRATNGSIWSSFTSIDFTSSPCVPPP